MQIMVAAQTIIFLKACLVGIVLGAVYDIFRIIRLVFHNSRWVIFIEDLLFFAVAAFFTFTFLVNYSQGQIRIFILIGEAAGFILYHFTVGSLVFRSAKKIINYIKKVLRWINRRIIHPIFHVFAFFGGKLKKVFGYIHKKTEKCHQSVKKDLKNKPDLLYNGNINIKKRRFFKRKLKDAENSEKGKNKKK